MKIKFFIAINILVNLTASEISKPKVSIITSVYKGDDFISGFLSDITRQTIFKDCELIIINANSPGNEEPVIKEYCKKFPNIIYKKLDKDPGLYAVWNLAIKNSKADYITNANIDDRRNPNCLEVQAKTLDNNPDIDLVYSGYYITYHKNETFDHNNYKWHVAPIAFTTENMQLCLGGPMPMWRKSLHEKYGYFDESYTSAGDFEMWNRAASQGSRFKKIDGYYGLYYHNPDGISTNKDSENCNKRSQEMQKCVEKYKSYWKLKQYYCTACDANYYNLMLNLIGSIHKTNYDNLEKIAVFNLGMSQEQIDNLNKIDKVEVFELEKKNPDIITPFCVNNWGKVVPGWYSFKPVVIKQALDMFPYVLWIDAGYTVLKSLDNLFRYIQEYDYFLCTIGDEFENDKPMHPVKWQTTKFLINKYNLNFQENRWILEKNSITSSVIGASQNAKFFNDYYETSSDINNFIDDGTAPNGYGTYRHDQSILTVLAYLNKMIIFDQDHTQQKPIKLKTNSEETDFYITWNPYYVSEKTNLYLSRGDRSRHNENQKAIRYKE